MRGLGMLLVVWGLVVPPVTFPLFRNYFPDVGVAASLPGMFVFVGDIEIPYTGVLQLCALMIGTGASLRLFTNRRGARRRLSSRRAGRLGLTRTGDTR